MKRREFVRSVGWGAAAAAAGTRLPLFSAPPPRPNIVFIMADDHTTQAMGCYGGRLNQTPAMDRIAREGVRFDDCFCTNGISAPSRAVILTGKYSHRNGLRDNAQIFDGSQVTFPKLLREAGYRTGIVGKWHLKSDPTGFDLWRILIDQGEYYNPDFIENGERKRRPGYATDLITDFGLAYIDECRERKQPFLLMLHHKAPHRNWQPAPRHLRIYDKTTFPEPETLFDDYATRSRAASEQEMTLRSHMDVNSDLKMGPPPARLTEDQRREWEAAYAPKREAFRRQNPQGEALVRWKYQRYMQDYLACVAAVDESVGRVLAHLDRTGLAADTLVVYTSDQGFFLGEHGWFDKRFMYEEALRMPLVMRLPGLVRPGLVNSDLVSHLDFGPTFLSLAGLRPPVAMQGLPFADILRTGKSYKRRGAVYYHYYEFPAVHMAKRHYGIRTKRYKLIHFYHDIDAWELYDLEKDPRELNNIYGDPASAGLVRELTAELRALQAAYGDSDELARRFVAEDLAARKKG
jgi:arylsulfatase A-like enzyme